MEKIIFYGEWSVLCDQLDANFGQRFIISGSDNVDGIYRGIPGTQIPRVSGQEWSIQMEWNDNAGSGWQPSDIRRAPSYTVFEGFVITLGADDNFANERDFDYNDMIVICKSLDPTINPEPPSSNPFNFIIPKDNAYGNGSTNNDDKYRIL